jgi:hypothetical protein
MGIPVGSLPLEVQNSLSAPQPQQSIQVPLAPPGQGAAPTAPNIGQDAPPQALNVDDFSKLFLSHLLRNTPAPPPPQNTQNGSFANKLQSAVTGISNSLGDAAAAGRDVRPGSGWLGGVTKTLAAQSQRTDAARQRDVENQQAQQRQDRENAVAKQGMAESNIRMLHEQKLIHQLDESAINSSIADGVKAVAVQTTDANTPIHGEVLMKDLTSAELTTQLAQQKIDPTTVTPYPTGRKQVGENADGTPQYRTTYTVVKPPPSVKLDDKSRALLSPEDRDRLPVGTTLSGTQYNQLYQNYQDQKAATAARDKTLADNEIDTDKRDQALESVHIGPDWNNALANHGNDPVAALKTMQADPAMRQKYPHLTQDVMQAYGGAKEFETIVDNQQKRQIEKDKLFAEQHPAGGALGNIPQSDGMVKQIADLTAANPSAATVLKKFDNLTQASLMAVAFGDGSTDFDKTFPVRLTKGASGLTAQNAIAVLKQINPNFNEQQYRATQTAYKEATTGKNAQAIQQYNNFIQHGAEAVDTFNDVGRKGPKVWNTAVNKLQNAGYGTEASQLESALIPVRGELALLSAGGYKPSEPEQKAIDTVLSSSATPGQISASLQKLAETGTIRLDNINENYKRVTGKNLPRIIDQKTLDAAKHLGVSPQSYGTLQNLDSNGTIFGSQTPTGANTPQGQNIQPPPGATNPVFGPDGKTLIGHVVNNKYVALGAQ